MIGSAHSLTRHRVLFQRAVLLDCAHQTQGTVKEGHLGGQRRHDGDGDRVRALLDVRGHGVGAVAGRHHGQRNHAVHQLGVDVLGDGGGAQSAYHAVAEHLVAVQVHHAAELVAQVQHHARDAVEVGDGERLLVQLDRVGGVGVRAHRALRPARRLRPKPVRRHLVHLVEPLRGGQDGVLGGEGGSADAQLAVVARPEDDLSLGGGVQHICVQERVGSPVHGIALQRHRVLVLRETEVRVDRRVVGLGGGRLDGVDHLVGAVLDREVLGGGLHEVHAAEVHQRLVAARHLEGKGAREGVLTNGRSHGERSARKLGSGNAADGAGAGAESHASGKGWSERAVSELGEGGEDVGLLHVDDQRVGGGAELDGLGESHGAHEGLHFVKGHGRGAGSRDVHHVVLVQTRVEVAERERVDAVHVVQLRHGEDLTQLRVARLAAPGESRRALGGISGGPDANAVDVRNQVSKGHGNVDGRGGGNG